MNYVSEKKLKEIIKELNSINNKEELSKKPSYYRNIKASLSTSSYSEELKNEFLNAYTKFFRINKIDTDDKAEIFLERDPENIIISYKFEIYKKNKAPLVGRLSRSDMETIYKLYSLYGANLTQKIVSREFPQYTFVDFKRILRAFNIFKADSEFPPHVIEEHSEEELIALHNQNKENNVLRKLEKDQLQEANKLINKLAKENLDYQNFIQSISNIKVDLKNLSINNSYTQVSYPSETSIIVHLSDMHIGSKCESNTLYPNKWDKEELERRLEVLADKLYEMGHFDTLILNMLGDNLDGMDNQTARRDHFMPQNMDNMEQVSTFIEVMTKFILRIRSFANHIKIYSVKEGNHDGIVGYVSSLALINVIQNIAPEIECLLFKDFIGSYTFKGHQYLLCHGKDSKFMKRGFPLNLDEKSKVMIYEWLEANNIHGDNIHFIKGDLHSNALNSCLRFDYRNVLSLYGASDYSNYNFSRNSYGVSYDFFYGDNRTIGTFENF